MNFEPELILNPNDTPADMVGFFYGSMAGNIQDGWYSESAVRGRKIASGQIVLGSPRHWFSEMRWSDQAWDVIRPLMCRR